MAIYTYIHILETPFPQIVRFGDKDMREACSISIDILQSNSFTRPWFPLIVLWMMLLSVFEYVSKPFRNILNVFKKLQPIIQQPCRSQAPPSTGLSNGSAAQSNEPKLYSKWNSHTNQWTDHTFVFSFIFIYFS